MSLRLLWWSMKTWTPRQYPWSSLGHRQPPGKVTVELELEIEQKQKADLELLSDLYDMSYGMSFSHWTTWCTPPMSHALCPSISLCIFFSHASPLALERSHMTYAHYHISQCLSRPNVRHHHSTLSHSAHWLGVWLALSHLEAQSGLGCEDDHPGPCPLIVD